MEVSVISGASWWLLGGGGTNGGVEVLEGGGGGKEADIFGGLWRMWKGLCEGGEPFFSCCAVACCNRRSPKDVDVWMGGATKAEEKVKDARWSLDSIELDRWRG